MVTYFAILGLAVLMYVLCVPRARLSLAEIFDLVSLVLFVDAKVLAVQE